MFANRTVVRMSLYLCAVLPLFVVSCSDSESPTEPPTGADATEWFWQSPLPQGNDLWGLHSFDAANAVAVGDRGTILSTVDGGTNWTLVESGTLLHLRDVDFADGSFGLVVGAKGTVLRSTDGGRNWAGLDLSSDVDLTAVEVLDAKIAVAVGDVVSKGETWILRTSDAGKTWDTRLIQRFVSFNDVSFWDVNTGFVVGDGMAGLVYKTDDGGVTWNRQENLPRDDFPMASVAFVNNNACVIVGGSTSLRTVDGGTNWTFIAGISPVELTSVGFLGETGVTVGRDGVIYSSTTGGDEWTGRLGWTDDDLYAVTSFQGSNFTALGGNGVIVRTSDGGLTWADQRRAATLKDLRSVSFVTAQIGMAVGEDGAIVRTTDGGATWNAGHSGTNDALYGVDFVDPMNGVAVGEGGTVMWTNDGGSSWAMSQQGSADLFNVSLLDVNTAVAVGDRTILWTTDGGAHWMDRSIPSVQASIFGVRVTAPNSAFVVGGDGYVAGFVYRTTDGGNTWADVRSADMNDYALRDVCFVDPNQGFAVGGGRWPGTSGVIFRTTDAGNTWSQYSTTTLFSPMHTLSAVSFADKQIGVAVGYSVVGSSPGRSVVFRTTDGGSTWAVDNIPAARRLTDVSITMTGVGTIVGDGGTILRSRD